MSKTDLLNPHGVSHLQEPHPSLATLHGAATAPPAQGRAGPQKRSRARALLRGHAQTTRDVWTCSLARRRRKLAPLAPRGPHEAGCLQMRVTGSTSRTRLRSRPAPCGAAGLAESRAQRIDAGRAQPAPRQPRQTPPGGRGSAGPCGRTTATLARCLRRWIRAVHGASRFARG
jgi:hypothetical protein